MMKVETPHYIVRTLEPADATPSWQSWMTDPTAASNLNVPQHTIPQEQIQAYFARFDGKTAHLIGIFEKASGQLVGIRSIYVDPAHGEFLVNVLIGETQARGKGARSESRDVIYRHFFETLGLKSARCSVVASNAAILRVMDRNGWVLEHAEPKRAASGQGTIELRHFRLTRETWRKKEAEREGDTET